MTVTAPLPEAGYSKRPLSEKLGFRAGMTVAFIGLPAALEPLASSAEFAAVARLDAWSALLDGGRFDAVWSGLKLMIRKDRRGAH